MTESKRTRYAIVGTGSRSFMYSTALTFTYAAGATLVALCDINTTRLAVARRRLQADSAEKPIPTYTPDRFEAMIRDNAVECVIVTSIDRTHDRYIKLAMELGCDVVTEKPLTIDQARAASILRTIRETGRRLTVAFNYRYAPRNSKVKELLRGGTVGTIRSVHFEWLLDTTHGADYFRRWHRDKRNSGGLFVHKATHHFDLVNWWLDSVPVSVTAVGGLMFYGRENAENRGVQRFYDRSTGNEVAKDDPFGIDLRNSDDLRELYLDAEREDGYRRDESVFGHYISIEDDMSAIVKYESGAVMTYHLNAFSPWEGFRIAFNGTEGRIEYEVRENTYVSGSEEDHNRLGAAEPEKGETVALTVHKHWSSPIDVPIENHDPRGHGGGDELLLRDLFGKPAPDPLGRAADHRAGIWSILTGICANMSMETGRTIICREVLDPDRP